MARRIATTALTTLVRKTRLLVFDFDGVFTDNTVTVFDDGSEAVTCWRGDGLGIRRLSPFVEIIVLSTETNPVVSHRCRKLSLPVTQGCDDKVGTLNELAVKRGLSVDRIAYVGNDINDLECLQIAGFPIVVSDAHPSVAAFAKWVTRTPGGRGAVREVCDMFFDRLTSEASHAGRAS